MESQTAVVNKALILIGVDEIISIDENSTPARKAKVLWPGTRDAVMRSHPWKCCTFRATLAQATETPVWGYSYQYQLPTNPYCLRVLQMEALDYIWTVQGRYLLTDEGTANILYVGRVEDVPSWDALLKDAIAARLAAELAFPLAGSSSLRETMFEFYKKLLAEARSVSAMEASAPVTEANDWLDSRI